MPSHRVVIGALLGVALFVVAAGGGWVVWAYSALHRPYSEWDGAAVVVDIRSGMTAGEMFDLLSGAGVIGHPGLLRLWSQFDGSGPSLQAGEYRFDHAASPLDVLGRLERGDVLLYSITIREGLDLLETADRFAEAGFATPEEMIAIFRDPSPILEFDAEATDLEGYLFPETYLFPRGTAPHTIALTLVDRFRDEVGRRYPDRATAAGLTVRQAVTLASMIERETSVPAERRRISRVFHNRLERAMKLQCDPTVLYALRREGREPARLTYRDLEFDSPWNTYVARGLPPGPIANPGKASLDAAVSPSDGDDLYFVAAPAGGHRFSETLAAHVEAVKAWRRYSSSSR